MDSASFTGCVKPWYKQRSVLCWRWFKMLESLSYIQFSFYQQGSFSFLYGCVHGIKIHDLIKEMRNYFLKLGGGGNRGVQFGSHFLLSSLLSRISTETLVGKSDACRTALQFSATRLQITRHAFFSVASRANQVNYLRKKCLQFRFLTEALIFLGLIPHDKIEGQRFWQKTTYF